MTSRALRLAFPAWLALVAGQVGLSPSPVFAADAAPSDAVKAARAKFQEGVRAYDKGQYEKARTAFLQTYGLHKHPAVLLNLGQSCLRAGHTLEADNYFRQYMREATMTPDQKAAAESGLAEARTKLSRLDIRGAAGAAVTIDGVASGSVPFDEPVDVEPGTHAVHAGTEDQSVSATAGQTLIVQFAVAAPVAAATASTTPTATPNKLLVPPKNMIPVYVASGVAVAGIATSIVMFMAKGTATDKATSAANLIQSNGGGSSTCSLTDAATVAKFGDACSALSTDNSQLKTDGAVADIALVIGLASLAGGVVYYLIGAKPDDSPARSTTSATHAWIVPASGRGFGGLALVGTF